MNGKPLHSASRFKSAYDFGFVTLDLHHAYSEDSGIYTCRASNSKGQAVTTGTLKCTGKYIFKYLIVLYETIHLFSRSPRYTFGYTTSSRNYWLRKGSKSRR